MKFDLFVSKPEHSILLGFHAFGGTCKTSGLFKPKNSNKYLYLEFHFLRRVLILNWTWNFKQLETQEQFEARESRLYGISKKDSPNP